MTVEHHEVLVVGAGQAGLAMGYFLARQGRDFVILDAADAPAAAWRSRWESLRLFTPARYDNLPGLPFPGDPDHHPTRDEVVDYLTRYAERFALPVMLNSRVRRLSTADGGYVADLDDRTIEADQVVVATGPFQVPAAPALAHSVDVPQMHSSRYRRPADIPPGTVLVVGGGNTGYQLAEELASTHEVHLAIGSRQMPLPQRLFGRDVFSYLTALGLMDKSVDSRIGRRMRERETLIGSSPRGARHRGVELHGRLTSGRGNTVAFADGTDLAVDAIVWATGFTRDHSWIGAPIFDARGGVVHRRGVTASRGLYFVGLPWQHTRGSALLGWVGDDAGYVAAHVDRTVRLVGSARAFALACRHERS